MASTTTRYVPRDYRRLCDCCGMPFNISKLTKHANGLFYCSQACYGERDKDMLSRGNAAQVPFRVRPVPNPKPLDNNYPNTLEADESALLIFLAQQIGYLCRYELVTNGDGCPVLSSSIPAENEALPTVSWAARYLYGMLAEGTRPTRMLNQATTLFRTAANFLLTRQEGSTTGPNPTFTRANDPFFGGFIEAGGYSLEFSSTKWITVNTATCGYALLLAYRYFGDVKYIIGARNAASYLRNVQAIGKCASSFTSTNAAGTTRLDCGALTSYVVNTSDFYSDHAFYPDSLLALQFWKELQDTDGDQSIGATAVVSGFSTTPAQSLSASISQLREFWLVGVQDVNGDTFSGFSATTPREFFNAFPASKPSTSPALTGTGAWEFQDGDASDGTTITSLLWAEGLSALYAYEGASDQVQAVSIWLRSFESNADYETPDNTSPSVLARTLTGEYDVTNYTLSTYLHVRDASHGYAAIAENGSSVYDWGALGLLARYWARAFSGTFRLQRLKPLNVRRRFDDGLPSDGLYFDRLELRGKSGLSLQSAYSSYTVGTQVYDVPDVSGAALPGLPSIASPGLVFSVVGTTGLQQVGGFGTGWLDQSGFNQHLTTAVNGGPAYSATGISGVPGFDFTHPGVSGPGLESLVNMKNRHGLPFDNMQSRTVYVLCKPATSTGGATFVFRPRSFSFKWAGFLFGPGGFPAGQQFFYSWWPATATWITASSAVDYSGQTLLVKYVYRDGVPPYLQTSINGNQIAETSTNPVAADSLGAVPGFGLGNDGGPTLYSVGFQGIISAAQVYDFDTTTDPQLESNIAAFYAELLAGGQQAQLLGTVNDAVRAAQFGLSYREGH